MDDSEAKSTLLDLISQTAGSGPDFQPDTSLPILFISFHETDFYPVVPFPLSTPLHLAFRMLDDIAKFPNGLARQLR